MSLKPLEREPLLVPQHEAARLLGVGKTRYFEMKKSGLIECVEIGGRPMAVYANLKRLAEPKQAA